MRILLFDPCPIYGFGLKHLLATYRPGWKLEQVADREAIPNRAAFDLLLYYVPVGSFDYRAIVDLRSGQGRKFKAVALTEYIDDELFVDFLNYEWDGLLIKPNQITDIAEALELVAQDGRYYSERVQSNIHRLLIRRRVTEQLRLELTETEQKILTLICRQRSSKQIAADIGLTHRTVEKYRDQLMKKTSSHNMVGLVLFAISRGYFVIDPDR